MPEIQPKTYRTRPPTEVISQLTPEELKEVVTYHISTHPGCNQKKALEICLPNEKEYLGNALAGTANIGKVPDPEKLWNLRNDLRGMTGEDFSEYVKGLKNEAF